MGSCYVYLVVAGVSPSWVLVNFAGLLLAPFRTANQASYAVPATFGVTTLMESTRS